MIYIAIISVCIFLEIAFHFWVLKKRLELTFQLMSKYYVKRVDEMDHDLQQIKVRLTAARKAHKFQEKALMKIIMLNLKHDKK